MFKIYDGRNEFYQWDLNRKLIVEDKSMTQVHFCNRTGNCSLIRDVYEVNGMYLVDVPNILLQDNWDIKVYGYNASYTKYSATYNVVARTKPENYVYTDEEQLIWEQLDQRIDELEENGLSDEKIAAAVEGYLEEHPVDLTGYATEGYVDAAIEAIELTPGPQGEPGADGYTPVKGVDYFDGADGAPGKDGVDGKDGADYVLTEDDKAEIAAMAVALIPSGEEVSY